MVAEPDSIDAGTVPAQVRSQVALPALIRAIGELGHRLDLLDPGSDGSEPDHWEPTLRALNTVASSNDHRLVAICGAQGVGKTTLMRSLYPAASEWIEPNLERGERIPIAVVEREGRARIRPVVVRRSPTSDVAVEDDRVGKDEWRSIVRGAVLGVLGVRLEVPVEQGFWREDGTGFLLLPGFERVIDALYQPLMQLSLATSSAAVIVTDEVTLANTAHDRILEQLSDVQTAGTLSAPEVQIVVALNRCDRKSIAQIEELRSVAASATTVKPAYIVPVGARADSPPDWQEDFRRAVLDILPSAPDSSRLGVEILRKVIRDDVSKITMFGRDRLRTASSNSEIDEGLDTMLRSFDEAADMLLSDVRGAVSKSFGAHYREALKRLETELQSSRFKEVANRVVDYFALKPLGKDRRLVDAVEEAWESDEACRLQVLCLKDAAQRNLRQWPTENGQLDAGTFSLLLERANGDAPMLAVGDGPGRAEPNGHGFGGPAAASSEPFRMSGQVLMMARLLPAAALLTRSRFIEIIGPPGGQRKDEGQLSDELVAGLFLGDSAPREDASALFETTIELFDMATRPKATGTGGNRSPTSAVSGLLSASAAHPLVVPVAGALLAVGSLLPAGNRAIRERDRVAVQLLSNQRAAYEEEVSTQARQVVELMKRILVDRMRRLMGLDDKSNQIIQLRQAVHSLQKERENLLELLAK